MPLSLDLSEMSIAPNAPFLGDLQGNILKGHGRDHTLSVFFHFNAGQQVKAKAWLAAFTKRFVTSATNQLAETKRFKEQSLPGGLFINLFLTKKCYDYLGIPQNKQPDDVKFQMGMAKSNQDPASPFSPAVSLPLNDPPVSAWETGFDGLTHVMVLIAEDDPYLVRAMKRAVIISLTGIATIMKEQAGRGLRNEDGNGIEHNGYADGVSQPLFFAQDIADEAAKIGHTVWNPEAPLNLALVRDKGGKTPDSCGSYLVFRKLEQNVKSFQDKEDALALAIFGPTPTTAQADLAGAMVVGRYENGRPLALSGVELPTMLTGEIPNDYDFTAPNADLIGSRCPMHAHTRKNNPRTDGAGAVENKKHRIVRRGIPYEDTPRKRLKNGVIDGDVKPTGGVGLLFMCFQANIFNQFEFIQRVWANNETFSQPSFSAGVATGLGPIIGVTPTGTAPIAQSWPVAYDNSARKTFAFNDVIKMKGGEYFFAPSLSFLQGLSTATAIAPSLQIFDKLDAFLTA